MLSCSVKTFLGSNQNYKYKWPIKSSRVDCCRWSCSSTSLPAEAPEHRTVCVCLCMCSGPLAGAVGGLLDAVADPGRVAAAVELHRAPLQPRLPAALAEASVRVDVVVVDAGGRTLPVTWHDVHLQDTERQCRRPHGWKSPRGVDTFL